MNHEFNDKTEQSAQDMRREMCSFEFEFELCLDCQKLGKRISLHWWVAGLILFLSRSASPARLSGILTVGLILAGIGDEILAPSNNYLEYCLL